MSPESDPLYFEPEDPEDEVLRLWKAYKDIYLTNFRLLASHTAELKQLLFKRNGKNLDHETQERLNMLPVYINYLEDNVNELKQELDSMRPIYKKLTAERAQTYEELIRGFSASIKSFEENINELQEIRARLESNPNFGDPALETEIELLTTMISTHTRSINMLKELRAQFRSKQQTQPM